MVTTAQGDEPQLPASASRPAEGTVKARKSNPGRESAATLPALTRSSCSPGPVKATLP